MLPANLCFLTPPVFASALLNELFHHANVTAWYVRPGDQVQGPARCGMVAVLPLVLCLQIHQPESKFTYVYFHDQ